MKRISVLWIAFLVTIQVCAQEHYKNGVVVSAHPEASKVGVDILKKEVMPSMPPLQFNLL